ncbi:MAG: hypothetical protein DRQ78_01695 [Epsilonproteobacteria bacterium]|nr:MAG: hypothetical protein DRQ78_01695 [Campylobacterota bacterium]
MRISLLFVILFGTLMFWQSTQGQNIAFPEVEIRKPLAMDIEYEIMRADTYLNEIRQAMSMQSLNLNSELKSAAQAHANYLIANDEVSHNETQGRHYFTGTKLANRTAYAGFFSAQASENLSTQHYDGKESVNGLLSAIYHRFGFLSPNIDLLGVGATQSDTDSQKSAFVYVMGNDGLNDLCKQKSFASSGRYVYKVCANDKHRIQESIYNKIVAKSKKNNPKIILYPYDGEEEVPPAFYQESPDPLPQYEVSGFPISIEFNDYFFKEVHVLSFRLYTQEGKEIHNVLLMDKASDPHQRFTSHQYALFPLERLDYQQKYKAQVLYETAGKEHSITWNFTTVQVMDIFHTVSTREAQLTLDTNKNHFIYFRPEDPHDIIQNIHFPTDIGIQFVDNHSIQLTFLPKDKKSFDITSETRRLHIELK